MVSGSFNLTVWRQTLFYGFEYNTESHKGSINSIWQVSFDCLMCARFCAKEDAGTKVISLYPEQISCYSTTITTTN